MPIKQKAKYAEYAKTTKHPVQSIKKRKAAMGNKKKSY